ncbi:MAG TPA: alternative ribosome rescue aminoacyl-tRNA hydrolase ArfB [Candidatus Krumholzibacteria bacterium]|nr:alternative ribosome rescue aminoacyl-tRNA hydrolase ArfB [Candidatus Krumholzibacteria bacterium]
MIRIDDRLAIDDDELQFHATTAQGPGGQHVNRSNTRVVVLWNVKASPSLDEAQRSRILDRLSNRISREGWLRVAAQTHRSQSRNRDAAVRRLADLVAGALRVDPPRKATKPSRAARRRRVDEKKRRGDVKRTRRKPTRED